VRYGAALATVLVSQVGVIALGAALYLGARPRLLAAFASAGAAPSGAAAVALSSWFLPAAGAFAAAASATALLAPMKRSRRMSVAATGLTASAFAVVFAALSAFVPLLAA
jgi:hypothetical protein